MKTNKNLIAKFPEKQNRRNKIGQNASPQNGVARRKSSANPAL